MKKFTLGSSSIGNLEKEYALEVLDNNYISPGPVVQHVEELCAQLHGKKHGLALNSGQSAIHLAIQAIVELFRSHGGEKPLIAVPACTYISTLAAVILAGCDFVLVDVELKSGNISPECLLKILKQQIIEGDPVDIIIPVHLYGKACDPRVFDIAEQFGVWVIEDACEATFAPNIGRGHILTTSFFSNHLISAGSGGMIMTDNDQLDEYCWKLVNHGRSARFGNDDIHRIAEKFHFDAWGHSMKWSDLPAAVAKAQIERRFELYDARRRNARQLMAGIQYWTLYNTIASHPEQAIEPSLTLPDLRDHVFMMYPIILSDEKLDATKVIYHLNLHGIEVRRMMPITNQPVVRDYLGGNLAQEFPVADLINRQGFYVGVHPELSLDDMQAMGAIINQAIQEEVYRVYIK